MSHIFKFIFLTIVNLGLLRLQNLMDNLPEKVKQKLEKDYVKNTYDNIAQGFSSTRYKKWPKVENFLNQLPCSTLLLDIGCGNGKYLDNPQTFNIGCDISFELLSICKSKGFEVVQCDMTRLPFKDTSFDTVICVAALHHIVSAHRRQECLKGMVNLLGHHPDNKLLIQVWSYEQELDQDNPYLKQNKAIKTQADHSSAATEVNVDDAIWIPIHKNRTPFTNQDLLVPFKISKNCDHNSFTQPHSEVDKNVKEVQYLRYYHVFKEKELDNLLLDIPQTTILESYYDRGNWCVIVSRDIAKG